MSDSDHLSAETEGRPARAANFITAIIDEDLKKDTYGGRVATRFPPEPNGYLHIGHAKSICLNFGLANDYRGACNLRFDDTNPTTEDTEYVTSIQNDIRWLGFDWEERLFYASDYFEKMYAAAQKLIGEGKAYVDSLDEDEIRAYRGTVTEPGRPSPYRDRSVEENLDLFRRMRAGEFPDGAHVLRGRIDMASPNMKMRDPLLYRIRHAHHHRTGDAWCIYPMYDFAHCLSDAFEGITHSLCTLEFENNRDLYDWVLDEVHTLARPHQYEFARLNLNYTVLSKRKLLQLVEQGHVSGWDDPRMPTLAGMRRRGYTPASIRNLCDLIGVAKANSVVDFSQLEYSVRDDLNRHAPRAMCVLDPVKLIIDNYPEDKVEELEAPCFPPDVPGEGTRVLPFRRELYIERDDFMEDPPKKFYRLAPGREVRLRYAYIVKCDRVVKDGDGNVVELHCSYDPATLGVTPTDRKVKGAIHWVPIEGAFSAEVRLYERFFTHERPDGDKEVPFTEHLNPDSLKIITGYLEPGVAGDPAGSHYQFERHGFFFSDPVLSTDDKRVFNKTVGLKDSWARMQQPAKPARKPAKPKPKQAASKVAKPAPVPTIKPEEAARMRPYQAMGLSEGDAAILAGHEEAAGFFQAALTVHDQPGPVANWLINEVLREAKGGSLSELPFKGARLGELVALIDEGTISGKIGKDVLAEMVRTGEAPATIVAAKGLRQVTDVGQLAPIVDRLIAENPDKVTGYRSGRTNLLGFFVGQVMKETRGQANPQLVNKLIREKLD